MGQSRVFSSGERQQSTSFFVKIGEPWLLGLSLLVAANDKPERGPFGSTVSAEGGFTKGCLMMTTSTTPNAEWESLPTSPLRGVSLHYKGGRDPKVCTPQKFAKVRVT